jgi:hypothetical protein
MSSIQYKLSLCSGCWHFVFSHCAQTADILCSVTVLRLLTFCVQSPCSGCWHFVFSTPSHTISFFLQNASLCSCFPLTEHMLRFTVMLMPAIHVHFTPTDLAPADSQLRRYSPFLCTEQCCTYRSYWHSFWVGCADYSGVVQLVGRLVTWCAGRAADSDTVVTVRTGLNFGADLC